MAQEIIVQPEDVWRIFESEEWYLRDHMKAIGLNRQFGAAVYLSSEGGAPVITAYLDDDEVESEYCTDQADCRLTAKRFFDDYLTEKVIDKAVNTEIDSIQSHFEQQCEIDDRESELDMAVEDFLSVALDSTTIADYFDDAEEVFEDIKDHFIEYLARKFGLPIRRPMFLEDEDGKEFYEDYPYDCMVFDDEDNPIYK